MSGLITGIAALAITATTTTVSFIQAGKEKKAQKEAEKKAAEAMSEARKRLSVNYADAMSIKKEPYQIQRDMLLSQGAQITEAARESERGAAAAAGRIYAGQQAGQNQITSAMSKELTDIENAQIAEDSRLRDMNVGLDLAEVEGAQAAAAQANEAANAATKAGWEGVNSMVQQGGSAFKIYKTNAAGRAELAATKAKTENRQVYQPIATNDPLSLARNPIAINKPKQGLFQQQQFLGDPFDVSLNYNNPFQTE